jgi:site-specific recombinase XerD
MIPIPQLLQSVKKKVSASSQNQAFNWLLFFFRHVLKREFGKIEDDIRTIQELSGHSDVRTTMIYTHTVKSRIIKESKSLLDL